MNAYICITNPGSGLTQPITGFTIYSNVDNYFIPLVSNVPIASFTGSSCPYVLSGVPEGTTTLRLYDFGAGCCIDIPYYEGFNICDICNPLGFSNNSSPNVGSISIGNLTGGCDPSISPYYMTWYGPGTGSTNQVFTSQSGPNPFQGASLTHPLTGTNQVYLTAGQYRPVIQYIDLNGVVYSYAFGATGDCFLNDPIVILPYTATNGTGTGDYQHELQFSAVTRPLFQQSGTIELSATTNFVPFRFDGNIFQKKLVIQFSGSAYPNPIQLENITLGASPNPVLTFDTGTFPKNAGVIGTDFYTRVLCLTGLTRNSGDTLTFYIDNPYATNPFLTDWSFYFSQLPTFDCASCILDTPLYKIKQDSFSATTGSCSSTTVSFKVSGCSTSNDSNKDIYKYILKNSDVDSVGSYGYSNTNLIPISVNLGNGQELQCFSDLIYYEPYIQDPNNCIDLTISAGAQALPKMYGNLEIVNATTKKVQWYWWDSPTGPSVNLFNFYQNQWNTLSSSYPINNDPTSLNYYKSVIFTPPLRPNLYTDCYGTNSTTDVFYFNRNTISVSFDVTPSTYLPGSNRYMITVQGTTLPTGITINYPTCSDSNFCQTELENTIIQSNNSSVTNPNTNGSSPTVPDAGTNLNGYTIVPQVAWQRLFNLSFMTTIPNPNVNTSSNTGFTENIVKMYQYQFKTYPSSGISTDSQTVINSVTANTCSNLTGKTYNPYSANTSNYQDSYWKYNFNYQIVSSNTNPLAYSIYANPILSNGQPSGNITLVGTGTGSTITVIDSNYFV